MTEKNGRRDFIKLSLLAAGAAVSLKAAEGAPGTPARSPRSVYNAQTEGRQILTPPRRPCPETGPLTFA